MLGLNEIAARIKENLENAACSEAEFKWQRAELYAQAREHFRADKDFGKWITENARSTGAGKPDSSNVVAKLIMCTVHLTQEQFVFFKYTRAAELMVKTTIAKQPDLWNALVSYVLAENKDYRYIRAAMKEVKDGTWSPVPVEPTVTVAPEASVVFVEGSFFSPVPEVRSLQEFRLTQDLGYCAQLLELPPSVNNSWTEEEITQAFRRVAIKYHSDRGGSDEDMQWVNFAKDNLIESISLINQIRQVRGE